MSEATYDDYDDEYDCNEEYDHDFFDDDDWDRCYECSGYGDDYFVNDKGELECYCPYCYVSANWYEYDCDD